MKIQAINSAMSANNCQPVNQSEFGRKKKQVETPPVIDYYTKNQEDTCDISTSDNSKDDLNQKYNLACQIAAYYKTQYDQLAQNKECIA